jgi:hypothetical protein
METMELLEEKGMSESLKKQNLKGDKMVRREIPRIQSQW